MHPKIFLQGNSFTVKKCLFNKEISNYVTKIKKMPNEFSEMDDSLMKEKEKKQEMKRKFKFLYPSSQFTFIMFIKVNIKI